MKNNRHQKARQDTSCVSRLPYAGLFAAQNVPGTLLSGSTSQKKAFSFFAGFGPGSTRGFGGARGFAGPFLPPAATSC